MNIAILTGGFSREVIVSEKSAKNLYNTISDEHNKYIIYITDSEWYVELNDVKYQIDKNDFTFNLEGEKIIFDSVYITIHGTPGEDGKIQGYFDILGIPYSSCSSFVSNLTFDKWTCNQVLLNNGINCAKSILLYKNETFSEDYIVERLGLPIFIKSNNDGSSFGVYKVKAKSDIQDTIHKCFEFTDKIIIERGLKGREFGQGIVKIENEIICLPITEIIPKVEFFDYQAKYEGLSEEVTPADLSTDLASKMTDISRRIYSMLGLFGFCRIDYIIENNIIYVLEINTTPGFTSQSIIPQQINARNKETTTEFLDKIILESIKRRDSDLLVRNSK